MAQVVQLKRGTASGSVPPSLADGEVAINEYDGKLFWLDKVANAIKSMVLVASPVNNDRAIATTGLLTGGGDLSANRTFDVPAASQAEAEAGTENTKAMTSLRVAQAIAALASSGWGSITGKPTTIAGYGITDAYVKTEVDTALAGKLDKAGGTLTGPLSLSGDPSSALQPATKQYVDNAMAGLKPKQSVRAATAAALPANTRSGNTLTANANGALTVDGVAVAVNDRVLIKNEATAANNGIYVVTAAGGTGSVFILTRAADFNEWTEIPGAQCIVEEGTANADTGWLSTANQGGTLNTTAITWSQWFGTGLYQAHTTNLDGWSAIAPSSKQDALGFTPVNKAGDTFTGDIIRDGPAGTGRAIWFMTGGKARFSMMANTVAETGGNAGSNFNLTVFDDTATALYSALTIQRTGNILFAGPGVFTFNGNTIWHSGNDVDLTGWTLVGSVSLVGVSGSISSIPSTWKNLRVAIVGLMENTTVNGGFYLKLGANNTPQVTVFGAAAAYQIPSTTVSMNALILLDNDPGSVDHAIIGTTLSSGAAGSTGEYFYGALGGLINYVEFGLFNTASGHQITAGTMYVYGRR